MADHVQPLIDANQALVDRLMGKSKTLSAEELAQVKNDLGPGAQTEFERVAAKADKNSPFYKQNGLDSYDKYLQVWYDQKRDPSYDVTSRLQQTTGAAPPKTPEQTAQEMLDKLTGAVTTAVTGVQSQTKSIVDGLTAQNTALTGQIAQQTAQFKTQQGALLQGFQQAQADNAKAMADLMKQMSDVQNQNTQAAKKPNYARALANNKALNGGGLSSTMLTGASGVAPTSLTLGRTSLLGA